MSLVAGVLAPIAFVTSWVVAGARTQGYSPVHEAISRLAAVGSPTRGLMTAGFVVFGVGLPVYGLALRDVLPGRTWLAAAASGLATLGIAACPLDRSSSIDRAHAVFAFTGYIALALTPLLAASSLSRRGHAKLAAVSTVTGGLSGACLAATIIGPAHGLLQRLGLTIVDVWLVAIALIIATRVGDLAAIPTPAQRHQQPAITDKGYRHGLD